MLDIAKGKCYLSIQRVMKITKNYLRVVLIVIAILTAFAGYGFSSTETYSNQVTIEVPSYLFIEASQKNLNLTFSDYQPGSETQTETVVYTVKGNGMMQSEGSAAMTARLDGGTFPNMDFKARVGAYTKQGGNTELGAALSDFVVIKNSDTTLARKANSTGDGKLLDGQIEVAYKAVAANSLQPGKYSQDLTLTLTDV